MALIKCPECGHDVSTLADRCPNCGAPVEVAINAAEDVEETRVCDTAEEKLNHSDPGANVSTPESKTPESKEKRHGGNRAAIIVVGILSLFLIAAALLYALTCIFGHEYDDGIITTQATCAEHGVLTYTCSKCGNQYTESIPETEHKYDLGAVTVMPTCEKKGVLTYTCKGCGNQYTKDIESTGHKRNNEIPAETITPATCNENGSELCVCKICGETFEETIPMTEEHTWIDATALCPMTCSVCGKESGRSLFDGHWRDRMEDHALFEFVINTKAGTYVMNELFESTKYGNDCKLFEGTITSYSDNQITTSGGWVFVYNSDDTVTVKDDKTFPYPLTRYSNGIEETRVTVDLTKPSKTVVQEKPKTGTSSSVKITDSEAFVIAQMIVESRLKAPSTAKFCKVTEATITKSSTDGDYCVTGWVDAQNGFGAQIRSAFSVTFTPIKNGSDIGYKNATCAIG